MASLANAGVALFSDDGAAVANDDLMRAAFRESERFGIALSQHSEDPAIIGNAVAHAGEAADTLGLPSAPAEAETSIVGRDIRLLSEAGGWLHVAHASTAGAVDLLRDAKQRGLHATAEVTPHHLTLNGQGAPG